MEERATPSLLWVLRSIWKAKQKISREEVERLADQLEAEEREMLERDPSPKPSK
jgi:hypothetical protein